MREVSAAETASGKRAGWLASLCCLGCVLVGLAFVPLVGIQQDEVLFANGIYPPLVVEYKANLTQSGPPIMLMTYIGALKTWIYELILWLFPPSPYSLRVPVLLIAAVALWLFFVLLRMWLDARTALIGCLLVATDSIYLLTSCFDWGPVALEHLLLGCALVAGLRAHRAQSPVWAGAAGVSFGLALWDKAIFIWVLAGLLIGTLAVYPLDALRVCRKPRILAAGLAGFLLGAAGLLIYNFNSGWATFTQTANPSPTEAVGKLVHVWKALDGSAMFGYLVQNLPARDVAAAGTPEKLSIFLSECFGRPQSSLQFWAVTAAALSIPLFRNARARRLALFLLIAAATAMLPALITKRAGGGTHHFVILWPLPQYLVAIAVVEIASRWQRAERALRIGLVAVLCLSNLLVTNQYFRQLSADGPATAWSDAIYRLSDYVESLPRQKVFVVQWGILGPLRFLQEGRRGIAGSDGVVGDLEKGNNALRLWKAIASLDTIFVSYTDENETFRGTNNKLRQFALRKNCRPEVVRIIADRRGRPVYQVFRFLWNAPS
jgi:hypothetical protein